MSIPPRTRLQRRLLVAIGIAAVALVSVRLGDRPAPARPDAPVHAERPPMPPPPPPPPGR